MVSAVIWIITPSKRREKDHSSCQRVNDNNSDKKMYRLSLYETKTPKKLLVPDSQTSGLSLFYTIVNLKSFGVCSADQTKHDISVNPLGSFDIL